ncbi:MAG: sulfatase-like hydrolase/transferase, partial [Verrucomicrobiota bacterium]
MKRHLIVTALVALITLFGARANEKPNFIIFLTDDLGWGDLACYGHPKIKTPYLDQFATEGVKFTQAYSACGVCSPSRASILTGRTPYRNGVWRWLPVGNQAHLRESEITIPELLREKGYEAREKGLPVVNIAQPFKSSGLMLTCWKDTGIESPEDFRGKTIGV